MLHYIACPPPPPPPPKKIFFNLNLFSQGKVNTVVVEVLGYSLQGKTELTGTLVAHSMRMLSMKKGHKRLQFLTWSEGSSRSSFLRPPGLFSDNSARSGELCRACCNSAHTGCYKMLAATGRSSHSTELH